MLAAARIAQFGKREAGMIDLDIEAMKAPAMDGAAGQKNKVLFHRRLLSSAAIAMKTVMAPIARS